MVTRFVGLCLLGVVSWLHIVPEIISLIIGYDASYAGKSIDIKKLMFLTVFTISAGINTAMFLISHRILRGKWYFIGTAKDIAKFRFTYQDIVYVPISLLLCTCVAVAVGMTIRMALKMFLSGDYIADGISKKRRVILGGFISGQTIAVMLFFYVGFSGVRNIVINEVQSNKLITEEEEVSDYIELYNGGRLTCEIYKVYLSDDIDNLKKVEISYQTIPAKGLLLVPLDHNVLSLRKEGGQVIYLSDSTGAVIDEISVPQLDKGEVYCRQVDGGADWVIAGMTPGSTNVDAINRPSIPTLSQEPGFYSEDFDLELYAAEGETIYYTIDGSIPTIESAVYETPIPIYDRSEEENNIRNCQRIVTDYDNFRFPNNVDKAYVIRAISVNEGGAASDILTATYFINQEKYKGNVVLSLVTDPDMLIGEDGIYVTGSEYDAWYNGGREGDAPVANFNKRGIEYEIPASFELFSDRLTFSQNVGLRVSGGSSRDRAVKSFSIYARKIYSGSKCFDEEIFDGVKSHKIGTRGGYINSICQSLVNDRSVATQGMIRTSVFLNGEFLCNTNLIEKYDARYFEEHYGIATDNVIVYNNGELSEGIDSDALSRDEIYAYLDAHDMSVEANYIGFCDIIDIQNYVDYMCIRTYIDDMDFSETKNCIMWRSREVTSNTYEDGRWRWGLYDLDAMEWGDAARWGCETQAEKDSFSLTPRYTGNIAINQQRIFTELKKSKDFCRLYVNTFMDLVNTTFQYENVMDCIYRYGTDITDYQGGNGGNSGGEYYDAFFQERADYIVPYMAQEFGLSGQLVKVVLSCNDSSAGRIQLNSITPDLSGGEWSGSYYNDYPVKATAIPVHGYRFVRWEGCIDSNEISVEVHLEEGDNNLYAVFEKD